MVNTNDWFYFIEALDKKTCNKIKKESKNEWKTSKIHTETDISSEERITGIKPIISQDINNRISNVSWTNKQWIYDIIWPFMQDANENTGWKYDISCAESMQITRYKKGGFYEFHRDGLGDNLSAYNKPNNKFVHGNVRKLSMTLLLNDNFEGGEFQFTTYKKEKCTIHTPEFNKIGSIIVFPSFVEHRVMPVTKGIRYSLVVWFLGLPFK